MPFFEIDILAGADRRVHSPGELDVLVGELPGDHILILGQRELVQGLAHADARFEAHMAKVIGGQRDLIADLSTDGVHIVAQSVDSALCNLYSGERVHNVPGVDHHWRAVHGVFDSPQ